MRIVNHRLRTDDGDSAPFVRSPNFSGSITAHEYLVMHFTAGSSAESSIRWLADKRAKASAHIVIGRDGAITQLVAFNRRAWHAGRSVWADRVGLNSYSIGIELDNAGRLTRRGGGWVGWWGGEIPDDQVVEAIHRNETESAGWQAFTEPQLEAAVDVAIALVDKYGLRDVVGHDDIAPGRKSDPGPAFPMESFRSRVLGRNDEEEGLYETTTKLNIRRGPGTEFDKLEGSPLPRGTRVMAQRSAGNWRYVDVLDEVVEGGDLEGWVHGRYLTPA
jgi:N-acetylmuramoyl-L-alanine amidase